MSFYKAYIKERENFETLEHHHGFATYQIVDKFIYLKDIYVIPEMRKRHVAKEIADAVSEIGLAALCDKMFGSVCLTAPRVEENLQVILSYGFSYYRSEGNLLFFIKEL